MSRDATIVFVYSSIPYAPDLKEQSPSSSVPRDTATFDFDAVDSDDDDVDDNVDSEDDDSRAYDGGMIGGMA